MGGAILSFCLYAIPLLLLTVVISVSLFFMLSPLVNAFERNGFSRSLGSVFSFSLFFFPFLYFSYVGIYHLQTEMRNLEQKAPVYASSISNRINKYETEFAERSGVVARLDIREKLFAGIEGIGKALLASIPDLLNTTLWLILLVPLLTLFLLQESQNVIRNILSITPNVYFEQTYNITHQILKNMGSYVNAKLLQGAVVGVITLIGLWIIDFPYAFILALISGVLNIIPYFGPIIAFVPAVIIPLFDPSYSDLLVPMLIVYGIVNVLDVAIVFPMLVSKVIDLHPIVVLLSVLVGGTLAGPMGMLIAIPIAAIFKITSIELLRSQH